MYILIKYIYYTVTPILEKHNITTKTRIANIKGKSVDQRDNYTNISIRDL